MTMLMILNFRYVYTDAMNFDTYGFDMTLESNQQTVLSESLNVFGNSLFLRHGVQPLEQLVIVSLYNVEKKRFSTNLKLVQISSISH